MPWLMNDYSSPQVKIVLLFAHPTHPPSGHPHPSSPPAQPFNYIPRILYFNDKYKSILVGWIFYIWRTHFRKNKRIRFKYKARRYFCFAVFDTIRTITYLLSW